MTRKKFAILLIVGVLLVSTFGAAAAQDEQPPTQEPSKFLTHPVVKLLGAYFGRDTGEGGDPVAPPQPGEPAPEPPRTPESVAEEIANYHEEGIGFGVLVKLYAMAEASREACAQAPEGEECTPLLVDDLVTELKSGVGMGALFKEYGKPALLGVGHVKKALKEHEQDQDGEKITGKDKKAPKAPKAPKTPKKDK